MYTFPLYGSYFYCTMHNYCVIFLLCSVFLLCDVCLFLQILLSRFSELYAVFLCIFC